MRLPAIVDIGAGYIDQPVSYAHMLKEGLCTVIGFEPQEVMLAALREKAGANETYRPDVIGDGREHTLHVSSYRGMTSLFENDWEMQRLCGFKPHTITEQTVQTVRLDDVISPDQHCDFLRMDVQGSEGMVLDGAHRVLAETVAVQLEVAFFPTYKGQPVFGELDMKLRDLGFIPHRFLTTTNVMLPGASVRIPNQIHEADLVYIKNPASDMTQLQCEMLAQLAHYVWGSEDLAQHCRSRSHLMEAA